jgi:hypothetical protein
MVGTFRRRVQLVPRSRFNPVKGAPLEKQRFILVEYSSSRVEIKLGWYIRLRGLGGTGCRVAQGWTKHREYEQARRENMSKIKDSKQCSFHHLSHIVRAALRVRRPTLRYNYSIGDDIAPDRPEKFSQIWCATGSNRVINGERREVTE